MVMHGVGFGWVWVDWHYVGCVGRVLLGFGYS